MKACALIPSHNHWRALPQVVQGVRAHGLPVIIVDDGSAEPASSAIAALHDPANGIIVHRFPENRGKGVAVVEGFRLAQAAGFTHAVQIDADGQHDLAALPQLLAAAEREPQALVSGWPRYDSSMPLGRRIGRWITHLWVFVETLSFQIKDSMCGFRVYPLAACLALLETESVGSRMDFDTDIMVRLFWRGIRPVMVPVKVVYPPENTSNFDLLRDNWRITRMHTRLVLGMLGRRALPIHWARLAERGSLWGLKFLASAYGLLGRRGCLWVTTPIVAYFFLTGGAQRRASRAYLGRVLGRQPSLSDSFRHYMDFAASALDTFAAWAGAIPPSALETAPLPEDGGAVLVVSHHGAAELSRALMAPELRSRLTVMVHTRHAENYNRLLAAHRGEAAGRMIQVTEIGPDTAIMLRERIERGEWVAVSSDRVPVPQSDRVAHVPFLGSDAAFPLGPWLLALLLDCPVHLLFCRRVGPGQWRLQVEPFAPRITAPRGQREQALTAHVAAYAARLEQECRAEPWQWYNFFDFWGDER